MKYKEQRKYFKTDKGRLAIRRAGYKMKYGITFDDYCTMCDLVNNICPICGVQVQPPDLNMSKRGKGPKGALVIDHCHNTGRIRGVLCAKCNVGLGMFNDNIDSLTNAIYYLTS
jgi:hypothetical protein